MRYQIIAAACVAALAITAAAHAQDATAPQDSVFDDTYITVGAGGAYQPSYEGSDDMVISAIPLVRGKVAGFGINPRPNGVAIDLIPDADNSKIGFSLGPVATYSRNRRSSIKDDVVRAAGKLKSAFDVGVSGGVSFNDLVTGYDTLSLTADVRWNVNSAYKGMVITPAVSYTTPVSRAAIVSLNLYAKHVDDDYASYYYDVSPVQGVRSGLPQYRANGGWASAGVGLLGAYDLNGNLLDGGLGLVAIGSYSRLLNDAKRTPYTSVRGDANQWIGALGVVYTF